LTALGLCAVAILAASVMAIRRLERQAYRSMGLALATEAVRSGMAPYEEPTATEDVAVPIYPGATQIECPGGMSLMFGRGDFQVDIEDCSLSSRAAFAEVLDYYRTRLGKRPVVHDSIPGQVADINSASADGWKSVQLQHVGRGETEILITSLRRRGVPADRLDWAGYSELLTPAPGLSQPALEDVGAHVYPNARVVRGQRRTEEDITVSRHTLLIRNDFDRVLEFYRLSLGPGATSYDDRARGIPVAGISAAVTGGWRGVVVQDRLGYTVIMVTTVSQAK
jgi:hypothetical protein